MKVSKARGTTSKGVSQQAKKINSVLTLIKSMSAEGESLLFDPISLSLL